MTKAFCDICEAEIGRNVVSNRVRGFQRGKPPHKDARVNIEIMCGVGNDGTMNGGDLCLDCLTEAVEYMLQTAQPDKLKAAVG
jgi:hypothetical protein